MFHDQYIVIYYIFIYRKLYKAAEQERKESFFYELLPMVIYIWYI